MAAFWRSLRRLAPRHRSGEPSRVACEGIHMVAMAVDDLEQTVKDLRQKGAQLIGADQPGGQVFIHPRSAHGVLVQLVEKS